MHDNGFFISTHDSVYATVGILLQAQGPLCMTPTLH